MSRRRETARSLPHSACATWSAAGPSASSLRTCTRGRDRLFHVAHAAVEAAHLHPWARHWQNAGPGWRSPGPCVSSDLPPLGRPLERAYEAPGGREGHKGAEPAEAAWRASSMRTRTSSALADAVCLV